MLFAFFRGYPLALLSLSPLNFHLLKPFFYRLQLNVCAMVWLCCGCLRTYPCVAIMTLRDKTQRSKTPVFCVPPCAAVRRSTPGHTPSPLLPSSLSSPLPLPLPLGIFLLPSPNFLPPLFPPPLSCFLHPSTPL